MYKKTILSVLQSALPVQRLFYLRGKTIGEGS